MQLSGEYNRLRIHNMGHLLVLVNHDILETLPRIVLFLQY
jgi:hypothetical protein